MGGQALAPLLSLKSFEWQVSGTQRITERLLL
ncbi:Uncharacterised protein [Yersinia frederiksenii]|jgi:hypothetical protein|uniref:Uncharacterized protein n=1 Tax=Yersinia frederiksenii TaxID=29484 RepID=A0AAI8ZP49_YERFR|nr:Uncharacterised protein [Yersinia frederiksenii]CFR20588.1 Uncharacterised protein [Yersinia frederiksenii]CNG09178.1 Uncharacterised protein [Yersinia frederiksenii]CNL39284.1 Uncharacterised protein [Yersinia frederiksenii]CQH62066.1 Uncharacterised protein [Yersinia frederiksenii]